MSRLAKVLLAIGCSVVFVMVSLSILVKVIVTPEKVRDTLLPLVEKSLQRKVEVGEIDIGIFTGVSFTDLRVQKKTTSDDFISVKLASLNYKLLALFSGNIVIDRILLEEPKIEIVRQADGRVNFDDLFMPAEGAVATPNSAAQSSSFAASAFDVLINKVSVKDGELLFVDRLQNPDSPYRYTFNQVNFQASQITLEKAFPIKLSAQLNGSQIDFSGQYDVKTERGDFDLRLAELDLVKFSPYFQKNLPGKLGSAILGLNLELQLQPNLIESKGKVQLDRLDLVLKDLPDAAIEQAAVQVNYALSFQPKNKQLSISTLQFDFNGSIFAVEGDVSLAGAEPAVRLEILADQLDLRRLQEGLPQALNRKLRPYSLAGTLSVRADLVGVPSAGSKLLTAADLKLIDVQMMLFDKRAGVKGAINYRDQATSADKLLINLQDQQLELTFKAENLLADKVRGNFQLSAEQLDLNQLLPQTAAGKAATEDKKPASPGQVVAEEIGPFDLPLEMSGDLQVGNLIYDKLTIQPVRASLLLKDNHLKIIQLRAGIAGGELTANSDINLGVRGLLYSGQMQLDQSKLMSLLPALLPQSKQVVSGLLRWQNSFSGRGTLPANLLPALQLNGLFQVQKGEIAGSALLEQLALFLGLPELKVLNFDAFESRYNLRDGLADISGKLESQKARMIPSGTIGVDGKLNLKLDTRIAPDLMAKIGVKTGLRQAVSDKDGWGMLPLTVKGNLLSPVVNFDVQALQQQAAEKIKGEGAQKLLDKIAPGGGEEVQPVRKLLEGTLNRLLGQ